MKKNWNAPKLVKLNVSETAASKQANHTEGNHNPGAPANDHQTGRIHS